MSDLKARVVVVGSFNVDHVWSVTRLPQAGQTLAGTYRSGPGGKGFNQAVAAARAGAPTTFICALGADVGGHLARALATADDIDLRDAASDLPTGTAGIYVDAEGRNSIVIGAGANNALSSAHVQDQDICIAQAAVVLAQLESPVDAVAQALQMARACNAIAMLNPAPANAATTDALLSACDVITPNETEFTALLMRHVGVELDASTLASLDDAVLHDHCRSLLPHATVVLTLGAAGCLVSHAANAMRDDDSTCYRVVAPVVAVVDTTGAGDAFNGALAASLSLRQDVPFARHAEFAVRYASQSVLHAGAAESMPRMPATAVEAR